MRVAALLDRDPAAAAVEAGRIVADHPGASSAILLLGTAQRACGRAAEATAAFEQLVSLQPASAQAQFELGRALAEQDRTMEARSALQRAVELEAELAGAWRELSRLHALAGETLACDRAHATYVRLAHPEQHLSEAASMVLQNRLGPAEAWLRRRLTAAPTDVEALRLLAEVQARRDDFVGAEQTLQRSLTLEPGHSGARLDLVRLLHSQQKAESALPLLARLLALEPAALLPRSLLGSTYLLLGDTHTALGIYRQLLADFPEHEGLWVNYGNAQRNAGDAAQTIAAYRKSIELRASHGEAWFCMANLKTFRFSAADVATMQALAAREDLAHADRLQLEFALGKALEDSGDFEGSFTHYARGNALRRAEIGYAPDTQTRLVRRSRALYTRELFAARRSAGAPAPDPIFILGLPRSGSTLLEQILASHSQVEGTRELADIGGFAVELGLVDLPGKPSTYPASVIELAPAQLAAYGERYLAQTRAHRMSDRPRFIDKMPGNFPHIGLIHLILPQARIIDARRSPMACCFANFKQHFHSGAWFTYSLQDLARYYRDYVELMAHYDEVLPGRVHRVHYEHLVADLEGETRRLLAYCGLPFEDACLRFHETRREVRTASSEQVRKPLYTESLDQWRRFEPWLGELREALGDLEQQYPTPPRKRT
jgi:tetratricopeptide (TPR) repeat protein